MYSPMSIKAEFIPGTTIEEAANEATRFAKKLGCYITFNFNGIECFAGQCREPQNIIDSYYESIKREAIRKKA